MIKQNDMVLNILANPTFEVRDFQAVGLKADNTNFRTEDEYLNIIFNYKFKYNLFSFGILCI